MIDKYELLDALRDPQVANLIHQLSDVDRGIKSQHHTLGKQRNQASPGYHHHDDRDSPALLSDYLRYDGIIRTATAGSATLTTDVNGEGIVTHGLSDMHGTQLTPFVVVATEAFSTQARTIQTGVYTATTFSIRMWIANTNARLASVSVTFRWIAIG